MLINSNSRMLQLIILLILSTPSIPLQCFDSQMAQPVRVVGCQKDEVCYAEYYALNTSLAMPTLAHYFDRFCVHKQHCIGRGLLPHQKPCLNFKQLDPVVAKTFVQKLRSERLEPNLLVHSHFCCCTRDRCNELGPAELHKLFNVNTTQQQHYTTGSSNARRKTRPRKGGNSRDDAQVGNARHNNGSNGQGNPIISSWNFLTILFLLQIFTIFI